MLFYSTRDFSPERKGYEASEVIMKGIADDGGLFVPGESVAFTADDFDAIKHMDYAGRAAFVLGKYLTDFTADELSAACNAAYGRKSFPKTPAPVTDECGMSFLELYHGPTCAFKDLALQLMPRLLSLSISKAEHTGKTALILVATSGDTGKAALEGFADVPRTAITVFYPDGGVSAIQRKQMLTQRGNNVCVYAVKGNFDDCQTAVKSIFGDKETAKKAADAGYFFSSANSINFGRLVPQIAYYISACADTGATAESPLDITVPTGNFGNILAAYMAKKAGAPIGRLVCASNRNRVLTDFFATGVYDRRREFYLTTSPSMDILVSSNLERLLCMVAGAEKTAGWMKDLREKGCFTVDAETLAAFGRDFAAYAADEEECAEAIRACYEKHGYLIDPHTAAGVSAAVRYSKADTGNRMLVVSTASPFKFAPAVCKALGIATEGTDAATALSAHTGAAVPTPLAELDGLPERFGEVVETDGMTDAVLRFIGA